MEEDGQRQNMKMAVVTRVFVPCFEPNRGTSSRCARR